MATGTTHAGDARPDQRAGLNVERRSTTARRAGWKARLITAIGVIVAFFGAAGPAAADDLVTNLSTSASGREGLADSEYIQSFTTGPNASGYLLESISIDFVKGSVGTTDPVYVYLHEDNGNGRPNHAQGGQVATLTKNGVNFAPPVTGVNKYKVWKARCYPQPPHGGGCLQDSSSVHLAPNTTHWVYVWAGSSTGAELQSDPATTETGATGWTLGDTAFSKPSVGSSDGVYTYTSISAPLRIKVEGKIIPPVTITIDDASATEGIDLTADFTVSLSRAADGTVTVDYSAIAIETAVTNDFEVGTGSLTFQPGETRKTISIPVYDDPGGTEADETFIVRLLRPTGATFEGNARFIDGTGTIVNSSALLIDLAAGTGTEASGKVDFRLFLNRRTNRPTGVSYSVNYNAGASPADLVQETTTGTATIAAGETETTISIGVVDDTISDNNEQFRLEIQQAPGSYGGLNRTYRTGTILNTETLEASFKNVPQDHDGSNTFTFQVHFTNDVSITPAAMRDHAFTVTNGDVTAAARINSRDDRWLITVDPDGDDAVTITLPGNRACGTQGAICSDEDHPVQLSNSPSATVARITGTPLTASFSNMPAEHTGADFTFDLAFTDELAAGFEKIKAAFRVSGGSVNRVNRKTKGSDLAWKVKVRPAGTGELTITLPATAQCSSSGGICTDDGRRLINSSTATVAGESATVETTPTVSIAGGSGTEGTDSSIVFTVTLDQAATGTVTVDYATSDGTADAGDDYTAKSGTLSFSAGTTSKTVSVSIEDDSENESDETFTVTLSNPSGADLETKTATGTIRSRTVVVETTPTVSIAGGSGTEGDDDHIDFTVTLDEAATGTVSVDYATSDGSADAGDDYTATSGTLSFSAGTTTQSIPVEIKDDIENESDETFTVTLSNPSGADLGTSSATGTIKNRYVAPLTARFENMPSEHDGSEFTFELHFSENPEVPYRRLRDRSFTLVQADVIRAKRQNPQATLTARVVPSWGGQATGSAEALWGRETMAGMAHGSVASGNRLDAEAGYGLPVGSRFVGTPLSRLRELGVRARLSAGIQPRDAGRRGSGLRAGSRRAAAGNSDCQRRRPRRARAGHGALVNAAPRVNAVAVRTPPAETVFQRFTAIHRADTRNQKKR